MTISVNAPGALGAYAGNAPIAVGSAQHRDLFCTMFRETHAAYDPMRIAWPDLDPVARARLVGLPFWHEAISVERITARIVADAVALETDPAIRDAIAMQGAEEARHAALLDAMFAAYDIPVADMPVPPTSRHLAWAFHHSGIGECFDSFFAFGLFALARRTGFFPADLIAVFEPVIQEEARHILFYVNWAAYRRALLPMHHRAGARLRSAAIVTLHGLSRLKTAQALDRAAGSAENFTLGGAPAVGGDLSFGAFLDLCLAEHERRFAVYDPRLLRPRFVPGAVRLARCLIPG